MRIKTLLLLSYHISNTNNGNVQPDNEVAKSLAYNNRYLHIFQSIITGVYTTTLPLAFN
jgi:hypothetical protein